VRSSPRHSSSPERQPAEGGDVTVTDERLTDPLVVALTIAALRGDPACRMSRSDTADMLDALLQHIAALQRDHAASAARVDAMRWIPVSERRPEGDGNVLVVTVDCRYAEIREAGHVRRLWQEVDDGIETTCFWHWWRDIGPLPDAALAQPDAARAEGERSEQPKESGNG
jgi:hypothetical protein